MIHRTRFDPDDVPRWRESVAHAETWAGSGLDRSRAERRARVRRWLAAVAVLAAAVAIGVASALWLGGV